MGKGRKRKLWPGIAGWGAAGELFIRRAIGQKMPPSEKAYP